MDIRIIFKNSNYCDEIMYVQAGGGINKADSVQKRNIKKLVQQVLKAANDAIKFAGK